MATRTGVYDAVSDYIDYYFNARCRHSDIGYLSPNHFEHRAALSAA